MPHQTRANYQYQQIMSSLYYHHQQHQYETSAQAQVQAHPHIQAQTQAQVQAELYRFEEEKHYQQQQQQDQAQAVVVSGPEHHHQVQQQVQQRIGHTRDEIFDILQSMMGQETFTTTISSPSNNCIGSIKSKWSSVSSCYDIESSFPATYDVDSIRKNRPRRQNVIHGEWRSKICQWLYNVVDHYDMTREIVTISLNYFDRFMASMSSNDGCGVGISISDGSSKSSDQPMSSDDFALLTSLTVLYVSTKIHISTTLECDSLHRPFYSQSMRKTMQYPTLSQLAQMSSQRTGGPSSTSFDVSSILSMEKILLEKLQWKVHPPTLHSFISLLLKLVELPPSTTNNNTLKSKLEQKQQQRTLLLDELYSTSIFIAELGVCDSFYVDHNIPSSIQAFACICITMDEMIEVNNQHEGLSLSSSLTRCQRDAYISTVCQRLGLCHSVRHKDMFRETCLRLRALYLEQQEPEPEPDDHEPADEHLSEQRPTTPSTEDTTDSDDSNKTMPPSLYANNSPPSSSPRSTTDMMSMSTMNSAMMAHSLADTITVVGDYYCGDGRSTTTMTSVKRNASLFSSSMGDNCKGDDGVGGDTVVNVTRGESMVSSSIGVTRGESMVSSMSAGVATAVERGDSMVSSKTDDTYGGRRDINPYDDSEDAFVDDDDGRHPQSNNTSKQKIIAEVVAVPEQQDQK